MRVIKCLILIASIVLSFTGICHCAETGGHKYALVYNGKYGDRDSAESLAGIAERSGFKTIFFSNAASMAGKLGNAKMVIIGGTQDELGPFIRSFTPEITKKLKEFIAGGGIYLGICGGAYIASCGWEEDGKFVSALELVPFETDAYSSDPEPMVIDVMWKKKKRAIFYQFGPKFLPPASSNFEVTARYDDGAIAAFHMKSGKGALYLVGPHPEADESWIEDGVGNSDEWESTEDLADDMMKDALSYGE